MPCPKLYGLWKWKSRQSRSNPSVVDLCSIRLQMLDLIKFNFPELRIESMMINILCVVLYLVGQSCPTLCDPMECSPPGSSVHGDSPGKNTGVGCHAILQVAPNPGSPHCRQILYRLSHQGSPRIMEWVSNPSPGDLPHALIEPGSPALEADYLLVDLPGKPINSHSIS